MTFSLGKSRYRRSSNLDQVIYILERLDQDSSASPEQMARELYTEENVIRSFIEFLKDMQWVKEKDRDLYSITERGNLWLNNMKEAMEC